MKKASAATKRLLRGKAISLAPQTFVPLPAPSFTCTVGAPSLATIYGGHYDRLYAVLDAARTGNRLLIKLAVEHQDKHGSGE